MTSPSHALATPLVGPLHSSAPLALKWGEGFDIDRISAMVFNHYNKDSGNEFQARQVAKQT